MAKKKSSSKSMNYDSPSKVSEERPKPIIPMPVPKPYIETITASTPPRSVDVGRLPKNIMIAFKRDPLGNRSNSWRGPSGKTYMFSGGKPIVIDMACDLQVLVLKAIKNPETWEIVY